ncbi:MAG: ABC transporter ATP-binding protein [Methylobacteriaceae bacterium]|nr:ABC transporter ATP-binding protein [Methylobacteriaceae bacterium]
MAPVLETKALHKHFGGLTATNNVTFALPSGARHALIGPNGAGKTTFVNLLSGVLTPTSGTVYLDGADVTRWPAHKRAGAGLARTFQINQLFADFSPLETIVLAISQAKGLAARFVRPVGTDAAVVNAAADLLHRLTLADVMHARVGSLPYGKQRLLEIAIAVASEPKVLLLDEPAAGVPESEREQILDVVAALPGEMALVLIEHDMDLVFRFAKSLTVLVNGGVLVEGSPQEIVSDPRVRQVYLGELHVEGFSEAPVGGALG